MRVDNTSGTFGISDTIEAIEYAQENGIPILNYSAGSSVAYTSMATAIENYSGLFVCSAGNNGTNNDETARYPSCYDLDNIISVGASTSSDGKRSTSNYGVATVDIFAPGERILSTLSGGGYGNKSGTSMAAPYVSGVAALLLSKNPNLTASEIKTIIMISCDKLSVFSNYCVSGGRLNAYKAVASVYTTVLANSSVSVNISEGEYHWYKITALSDGWFFLYTLSDLDMFGELFYEIVSDESIAGRIAFEDDIYEPDDGNDPDRDFYFMYALSAGETIYLRVSARNIDGENLYTLRVINAG